MNQIASLPARLTSFLLLVLTLTLSTGCQSTTDANTTSKADYRVPRDQPKAITQRVMLGIDVLAAKGFETLRGQRVGLVVNPASVDGNLKSTVDVLIDGQAQGGYQLVALFGPEHGVWGDVYAGDKIDDQKDPRTGLPVFSLYGDTRKPTPEMLENLDVLIFDMQDIGSRSYTYISTMSVCLEASAEQNKRFIVLDRPNPLGGTRVEGPMLDPELRSFIGYLDVPYIHGMTMGELAQLERDRIAPTYDGLEVIQMKYWTRDMVWEDTGLEWVPTSPHIPFASSTYAYAATGVLGELLVMSNGVGYTLPFEIVGDTGVDPDALAAALNNSPLAIKGVTYRPARFRPFYATHQGEVLGGVQIYIDPRHAESLYQINFLILNELDAQTQLAEGEKRHGMFDKANGTTAVRTWIEQGKPLDELFAQWERDSQAFHISRLAYLLYQ
ncbi:exo-beta-N-acetylmuramidase NamZ family protein [Mucisphaera sp.]|uniref:exo-beta-N-acetylmuramidase NamZ family protein n=1 Tax=Mucisphaera sp. TaxID=2913024 RepID=UPI003D0A9845